MRRAWWMIIVIAPLLAGAGRGDPSPTIEKQVQRLADQHNELAAPAEAEDGETGTDCRWLTQTVTHQGATHTRRVRTCQSRSWWSSWLEKSRRTK